MAAIGDARDLMDVKKERDDVIAERDVLKKQINERNSRELGKAGAELKQCVRDLELVRSENEKLEKEMRSYARRWKQMDRDMVMVVEYAEEQTSQGIAAKKMEQDEKVKSLENEIKQWRTKYDSTVVLNESEREANSKDTKQLEEQLNSLQQTLENERQMASKRESDLAFQISELERTAREQKATLEQYSHEQDRSIDTLDITSMKINNNHHEGEH